MVVGAEQEAEMTWTDIANGLRSFLERGKGVSIEVVRFGGPKSQPNPTQLHEQCAHLFKDLNGEACIEVFAGIPNGEGHTAKVSSFDALLQMYEHMLLQGCWIIRIEKKTV